MKLTPADLEKLQTKELANAIRKLHAGKTLTAAERALLAQATVADEVQTSGKGYVANWHELADALGVNRMTINAWRSDPRYQADIPPDKPDGRKSVALWFGFIAKHHLNRGRSDAGNEDFDESGEGGGDDVLRAPKIAGTQSDWTKASIAKKVEKQEIDLANLRGTLLVASELELALGATYSALQTKLSQFPERTAPQVAGFTDVHEIIEIMRAEMDADLSDLNAAQYLEDVQSLACSLPFDPESARLLKLVSFEGQDVAALQELIVLSIRELLRRFGRRVIHRSIEAPAELVNVATGQVTDEAEEAHALDIAPRSGAVPARSRSPKAADNPSTSSAASPTPPAPKAKRGTRLRKDQGKRARVKNASPKSAQRGRK